METFLIRALQLIMSLSLLVIVHEGGALPICASVQGAGRKVLLILRPLVHFIQVQAQTQ